jgi:hypothetical protein
MASFERAKRKSAFRFRCVRRSPVSQRTAPREGEAVMYVSPDSRQRQRLELHSSRLVTPTRSRKRLSDLSGLARFGHAVPSKRSSPPAESGRYVSARWCRSQGIKGRKIGLSGTSLLASSVFAVVAIPPENPDRRAFTQEEMQASTRLKSSGDRSHSASKAGRPPALPETGPPRAGAGWNRPPCSDQDLGRAVLTHRSPPCSTTMRSKLRKVESRCAMAITVRPPIRRSKRLPHQFFRFAIERGGRLVPARGWAHP